MPAVSNSYLRTAANGRAIKQLNIEHGIKRLKVKMMTKVIMKLKVDSFNGRFVRDLESCVKVCVLC